MRWIAPFCGLFVATHILSAQFLVDPSKPRGKQLVDHFEKYWSDAALPKLACRVSRIDPWLDYSQRIWTGYSATFAADQFQLQGKEMIAIAAKVVPESQPDRAAYLSMRNNLPLRPKGIENLKKIDLSANGGFFVGRGKYSVRWMLVDSYGRVCRSEWKLNAKAKDSVPVRTAASTIEPANSDLWNGFPAASPQSKPAKVTVFLHATPVWPRRYVSRLSPWDRQVLGSTLISLLQTGNFTSASVVAFDVQGRRVLYRSSEFNRDELERLADTMAGVGFATISFQTLKDGPAAGEFLRRVVQEELQSAQQQSDAVVFIGSSWRQEPKVNGPFDALRESLPKVYFLAFSPPMFLPQDTVSQFVRGVKGKVITIAQPVDLTNGLQAIAAGK